MTTKRGGLGLGGKRLCRRELDLWTVEGKKENGRLRIADRIGTKAHGRQDVTEQGKNRDGAKSGKGHQKRYEKNRGVFL